MRMTTCLDLGSALPERHSIVIIFLQYGSVRNALILKTSASTTNLAVYMTQPVFLFYSIVCTVQ